MKVSRLHRINLTKAAKTFLTSTLILIGLYLSTITLSEYGSSMSTNINLMLLIARWDTLRDLSLV